MCPIHIVWYLWDEMKERAKGKQQQGILSNEKHVYGGRINLIEVRQGGHAGVRRMNPTIEL